MLGLTPPHLLIVALVAILLFGAKRLPDVARGLGKSARILKAEVNGLHEDDAKRSEAKAETKQLEARPAQADTSTTTSAEAKRSD
jgi:sec-independent protein translocase protein TatA